jgi:proteasome lid subunit RPN8/RPN11
VEDGDDNSIQARGYAEKASGMTLKVAESDLKSIRRHGEESYPNECCGVLVGSGEAGSRRVVAVVRCDNMRADSPQNRYSIGPGDLIRIQREAQLAGRDIIGFYHSHPDHPAQWSSTDLAEAYWIGCSYVITSIHKGKAELTNSFLLRGEEDARHFESEEIVVEDGNAYQHGNEADRDTE